MKKVIIINLSIIFLIIMATETTLRIFLDITPQGISKGIIDENSSEPRFNYKKINKGKVFGQKVYTDEDGFRISKDHNNRVNQNNRNIYFVGGSVTFGSGVKQSETFSGLLNRQLGEFNIYNASVTGSNLKNNIDIIKKKIDKKNLEMIYINFSLDDIQNNNNFVKEIEKKKTTTNSFMNLIKKNYFIKKINIFIRSKSVTYVWVKGVIFNSEKNYYLHALNTFKNKSNLISLKILMKEINKYNKELNDKIKFLIIPYSYQITDSNCQKEDYAERIIEKSLKENNLKYFKIKNFFCGNNQKNKIFFNQDPSHLSKYGHNEVAKYLKSKIK